MLHAILGEMKLRKGRLARTGSVSYVAQVCNRVVYERELIGGGGGGEEGERVSGGGTEFYLHSAGMDPKCLSEGQRAFRLSL